MGTLAFMPTPPATTRNRGPRYFQVKVALQQRIGDLEPGMSLPPERKLATELGTSRTTLRRALAELTAEGVLSSTQGSGNFVTPPKLVHVRQLTSFSDDLGAQGRTVDSEILDAGHAPADTDLAVRLEVPTGTPVHRLTRLRIVNDEPLALETAHIPGEFDDFADAVAASGSLYATLRARGIVICDVEDSVQTALAVPDQAAYLRVATGTPLLQIERTSRDADGTCVEWTRSYYRGDRVRFVARGRL
ncbi:MAG: GntR family transcriptional regulator, partial [Gordonia polyisoprenivorans]|nr:GntR family transcriptional regulator [Gordonia polyisoprenivorans]